MAALLAAVAATVLPMQSAAAAPRITASKTTNLNPAGETIRVQGSGFDENKGIYLALCIKAPKATMAPGPCGGGGVLLDGSDGSSQWISSNPPTYGEGIAVPYGPGGSFDLTIRVSAVIQPATATRPAIDCRAVACWITTRSDHTRSTDRSQDQFIPVTFAGPPPTTTPPHTTPPTTKPPTTPTKPANPATPNNPKTPSNPSGNAANPGQGGSASGPATGSDQATPPPSGGNGDVNSGDAAATDGVADDGTPVTIPSSLFGEDGDPDTPGVTVQGDSESNDTAGTAGATAEAGQHEIALAADSSTGNSSVLVFVLLGLAICAAGAGGGFFWWRRNAGASSSTTDPPVDDR